MGDTTGIPAKFLDLQMMMGFGERENEEGVAGASCCAGFRIKSINPLDKNFGTSILEGVKR